MGLFDTIYVSSDVAAEVRLVCDACGRAPAPDADWQSKSIDAPCMRSYFLRHDEQGAIRLFLLDRPSDQRFWRAWTDEEIADSERDAARGGLFALWLKRRGEGALLPEAYLPQNRRQRCLGELPHRWVEVYGRCPCGATMEHWLKFCDGVATAVSKCAPTHPDGLSDEAGGWFD